MPHTSKREIVEFVAVLIFAASALVFLIFWNYTHPRIVIKYDCSISEISPDYPIEVKEGCRKLRADNFLQKPK
jgi:hypothetical protein